MEENLPKSSETLASNSPSLETQETSIEEHAESSSKNTDLPSTTSESSETPMDSIDPIPTVIDNASSKTETQLVDKAIDFKPTDLSPEIQSPNISESEIASDSKPVRDDKDLKISDSSESESDESKADINSERTEDTSVEKTEDTSVEKTEDTSVEKTEDTSVEKTEDTSVEKTGENVGSEYDPKNVHYEGDVAIYTDPKSGYQYKWCNETNDWLPKGGVTYGYEDDTHTYMDADDVKYFWDVEKNAWFPKIDDEFMARYQMSYGFIDNKTEEKEGEVKKEVEEESEETKVEVKKEKTTGVKRKIDVTPPTWFEINDQQNTKVYVSNLPTDITEEEFVDLMQKYGLVMRDVHSGKMKVKLYTVPETDILKGDALCTYIKIESVELALKLLDGYLFRGKRLKVERAKFQMKGEYNASLKPKKKKRKDKDKLKKMQEKLFDWRPEKMRGERSKHERVVIVKNLFEPTLFDRDVSLILEYQQDLREECGKCGEVKRVVLYDRHPEGVAQISMKEPEEADECVTLLNGRWFGQRKLTAEIWDGKTKFKIAETDAQISKRIDNWEKFLDDEDAERKAEAEKNKTPEVKVEVESVNSEKSENM